jgi:hypothetical protein
LKPRIPRQPLKEAYLRIGVRLREIDLDTIVDFYDHSAGNFQKKIEAIHKKCASRPDSYWKEDLGMGTTRGELVSEERQQLEHMLEMNGYFGVLGVYSVFERCLHETFDDMKRLKLIKDKQYQKKPFLTLDQYKDCFKPVGINLTQPPFGWDDIKKLQALRNAIAHQDGYVVPENLEKLKAYGYKVGEEVNISEQYFRSAVKLVKESCSLVAEKYSILLP